MCIAPGGSAKRKQRRPVARIPPDRQPGAHDDPETVAQGVQLLDSRDVCHQAEGVAADVKSAGIQPRPGWHSLADQPGFKPLVAPFPFGCVNRTFITIAWIESAQQLTDNCCLVLLHLIPQRQIEKHAARLNLCDAFGRVLAPPDHTVSICPRQPWMAGSTTQNCT